MYIYVAKSPPQHTHWTATFSYAHEQIDRGKEKKRRKEWRGVKYGSRDYFAYDLNT